MRYFRSDSYSASPSQQAVGCQDLMDFYPSCRRSGFPHACALDRFQNLERFETETGTLGIELTEILPPPRNHSFSSPVAEESLHKDVVLLAEEGYCREPGAIPVKATVYFWDLERGKRNKQRMARALVDFVKSHCGEATPVATFQRRDQLPDGFGVVSIASTPGPLVQRGICLEHSRRYTATPCG